MNYSTFEEAVEQGQWPIKIDVLSVYRAFEQIIDGRHKRGVRYRVEEILTLIRLGQIGRDDYSSSQGSRGCAIGLSSSSSSCPGNGPAFHVLRPTAMGCAHWMRPN